MGKATQHDDKTGPELLLFDSGGRSFAVEAISIDHIAGPDWRPTAEENAEENVEEAEPEPRRVSILARVLGLPAQPATRTLVVDSGSEEYGFQIEHIGGEYLGRFEIRSLPHLLGNWLAPLVVTGIAELGEERRLVSVLDLRLMARLLLTREIQEA